MIQQLAGTSVTFQVNSRKMLCNVENLTEQREGGLLGEMDQGTSLVICAYSTKTGLTCKLRTTQVLKRIWSMENCSSPITPLYAQEYTFKMQANMNVLIMQANPILKFWLSSLTQPNKNDLQAKNYPILIRTTLAISLVSVRSKLSLNEWGRQVGIGFLI